MNSVRWAVGLAVALIGVCAGGWRAIGAEGTGPAPPALATQTITVVLEAAEGVTASGRCELQLRVFEAEDPDAPPQVTTMASRTVAVESLALPMAAEIEVPVERLAAAMRPAVGVLVLQEGRMVLWNDSSAALSRAGPTVVRLAPVP